MNIPRNVALPVMLALSLISLLVAVLTFFPAVEEFYQYDLHGHARPALASVFHSALGLAWLLPAGTLGIGVWLLRQPACSAAQFTWSVSTITVALFTWTAFAFVAVYTLHAALTFYL